MWVSSVVTKISEQPCLTVFLLQWRSGRHHARGSPCSGAQEVLTVVPEVTSTMVPGAAPAVVLGVAPAVVLGAASTVVPGAAPAVASGAVPAVPRTTSAVMPWTTSAEMPRQPGQWCPGRQMQRYPGSLGNGARARSAVVPGAEFAVWSVVDLRLGFILIICSIIVDLSVSDLCNHGLPYRLPILSHVWGSYHGSR